MLKQKQIKFDPIDHKYEVEGIRVPSTSDVLNLLFGEFYSQDKSLAEYGKKIHHFCQLYLLSFDPSIVNEKEFCNFIKFCEAEGISPFENIITEEIFFSNYGYCGTRDIHLTDRKWIIDLKTGQENKERDTMQLIAYLDEMNGYKLFNLYLSGDTYQFKERLFDREKYRVFQCAAKVLSFNQKF